mgnify:CR=1 FL=1
MFDRCNDNSGLVAVRVEKARDISQKIIKKIKDARSKEWEDQIKLFTERKIFPLSREKAIKKIHKDDFYHPDYLYVDDMIDAKRICRSCYLADDEYIWLNLNDASFIYNMSDDKDDYCE